MGASMELGVKLFASVREAVGAETVDVRLEPGARVADLLEQLARDHPEIASRKGSLAVAVNCQLARGDQELVEGDEVALIPPVGGG